MKKDLKISFEFFPPKNLKMHRSLWNTLNKLKIFYPDFVSITYGAGGSTRKRTHETIKKFMFRPFWACSIIRALQPLQPIQAPC